MTRTLLTTLLFSSLLMTFNACNNDVPNDDNAGNETFLHSEKNESVYDTGVYIYPDDKLFIVLGLDAEKQHTKTDKKTTELLNSQGASVRKFLEQKGYKEYSPSSKRTWAFKSAAGETKVGADTLDNTYGVLIYSQHDSVFIYKGNDPEKDLMHLL